MAKIIHLSKKQLDPVFGSADKSNQIAYVREDLPRFVKRFVTIHELHHLRADSRWWVWREIKASGAGGGP